MIHNVKDCHTKHKTWEIEIQSINLNGTLMI